MPMRLNYLITRWSFAVGKAQRRIGRNSAGNGSLITCEVAACFILIPWFQAMGSASVALLDWRVNYLLMRWGKPPKIMIFGGLPHRISR